MHLSGTNGMAKKIDLEYNLYDVRDEGSFFCIFDRFTPSYFVFAGLFLANVQYNPKNQYHQRNLRNDNSVIDSPLIWVSLKSF